MSQVMEVKFYREKEERKALVTAIGEILGCKPVYQRAPSLAYTIGDYTIDRHGTLSFDMQTDEEAVQRLLAELSAQGFKGEGAIYLVVPSDPALAETQAEDCVGEGVTDLMTPSEPAPVGGLEESVIADDADSAETSTDDETAEAADGVAPIEESDDEEATSAEPAEESGNEFHAPASSICNPTFDDVGDEDVSESNTTTETPTESSALGKLRSIVDEHGLNLTIVVPFVGFTTTALENLDRLVSGKSWLIMKALGTDALPINRTIDTIGFPWFPVISSHLEVDAYARFVHALCEMSKKQKRVTLKEKPIDPDASEKFAFRCFLLRLGFIGKDYASARKVLLSRLSGSGSFKAGDHKKREAVDNVQITQVDEGVQTDVAVVVADIVATIPTATAENIEPTPATENPANTSVPLRCQVCPHHCYYSEGELQTSTGEIVDTSMRKPDKYTHYCLGVPRGFRKLKHAAEWSGGETPPKWCPLAIRVSTSDAKSGSADENVMAQVAHGLEVAM